MDSPLTKEEKERERRLRRKAKQKQKKKEDALRIRKQKISAPITVMFNQEQEDVNSPPNSEIGPSNCIKLAGNVPAPKLTFESSDLIFSTKRRSTRHSSSVRPSNDHFKAVIEEYHTNSQGLSDRKSILSFFTMILEEYSLHASKNGDTEKQKRSKVIDTHLKQLKASMSKKNHTLPEFVQSGLLSIRASLLNGEFTVAEEHYLNLGVGEMVPENHHFWDVKMDIRDVADILVSIKRLMTFFCTIIFSPNSLVCSLSY